MPAPSQTIVEPPRLQWPPPDASTPAELQARECPNCGSRRAKSLVLSVTVRLPANPRKHLHLLHCPDCTARFYDDQAPPDYAEAELNSGGRVPFYVQQGAGLNLLIRPLAQIRQENPRSYLEVGCGYGFGLDYALRTRRWSAIGVDPAPLAALGREALDLPIELRYLGDEDAAAGLKDIVAGAEVVEHLPSPPAFVRKLRSILRPGGVLILTTPNGDDIAAGTPPGILIPLLSPALHLVIQSASSLRSLLQREGFAHVEIQVNSHSLVAFASDSPLDLDRDDSRLRSELRRHLERRAEATDPAGDPFLGFAGRAFQEAVNDGDWNAADRAWMLLVPSCHARFGLDLAKLESLPAGLQECGLDDLASLIPMNLGGLLYASAMRQLAAGASRSAVNPRFRLASEAARAMRRALQALAMEDGQTEDIGWTAEAEIVLCAAYAGDADLPAHAAALPSSPSGGPLRRQSVLLRAVTTAVNCGHYKAAADLVRALDLNRAAFAESGAAPRTEPELDALYSLAILALNYPPIRDELGGIARARARLMSLLGLVPHASALWQGAFNAERNARQLLEAEGGDRDTPGLPRLDEAEPGGAPGGFAHQRSPGAAIHAAVRRIVAITGNAFALLRSPRQTVDRWVSDRTQIGPNVCIFAHWDADAALRPDVLHHVNCLADAGISVVFASNSGRLREEALAALRARCAGILVRRNVGYDFGAWREALASFELPRRDTEMLVLANDSVYGPLSPIANLLRSVDFTKADFWGCTDSREFGRHLQSYWTAFGPAVVTSAAWQRFWRQVRPGSDKRWIVRRYEVGLTQALLGAGFQYRAIWPEESLLGLLGGAESPAAREQCRRVSRFQAAGQPFNPTCELWRPLLRSGFPFIKRELLQKNGAGVVDAAEWRSVAASLPGANPETILQIPAEQGSSQPGS